MAFFFSDYLYQTDRQGQYIVSDPDSVLFLRLFEQSVRSGKPVLTDSYGTFPHQIQLNYPPFHLKLLIETALLLIMLFPDHQWTIAQLIGWFPPVFGWLVAVMLIVYSWQKTKNRAFTMLLAFACIPGPIAAMNSMFLKIDYHFLNHFLIWAWIICGCFFIDSKHQLWLGLGTAAATAFIFTWGGTPLFFLLVTIYSIWLKFSQNTISLDFDRYSSTTMIFPALFTFLYLATNPSTNPDVGYLGLFQPSAILLGGFFIQGMNRIQKLCINTGSLKFKSLVGILVLAILAAVAVLFHAQVKAGMSFIFVSDMLMQSIKELKPGIDFSNLILNGMALVNVIFKFGLLFFFIPLLVRFNPDRLFSGGGRLIRDFSVLFLLMGCFALRYFRWLGIVVSFWNGIALFFIFTLIKKNFSESNQYQKASLKSGLILLPFMLVHFLMTYPFFFLVDTLPRSTMQTLDWISSNTPPTSGYFDDQRPEYCFYAPWGKGNIINYYSRRPTLTNNTMCGYGKMAEVFTADSEEKVYSLAEEYGIRYFYVDNSNNFSDKLIRFMRAYSQRKDLPKDRYNFFPEYVDYSAETDEFAKTFHFWLSHNLAINPGKTFTQPANRLRIVFCLGGISETIAPRHLVYEMVKGAEISGFADPGSIATATVICRFDKITIACTQNAKVADDGTFAIKVPYSNGYKNGNVSTEDGYRVSILRNDEKQHFNIVVTEEDLRCGNNLKLPTTPN